jgi:hypothetical protein
LCEHGFSIEPRRDRFGQAEVDDSRHRFPVYFGHQNVRRLQVSMDDGLLVRVLHAFTYEDE